MRNRARSWRIRLCGGARWKVKSLKLKVKSLRGLRKGGEGSKKIFDSKHTTCSRYPLPVVGKEKATVKTLSPSFHLFVLNLDFLDERIDMIARWKGWPKKFVIVLLKTNPSVPTSRDISPYSAFASATADRQGSKQLKPPDKGAAKQEFLKLKEGGKAGVIFRNHLLKISALTNRKESRQSVNQVNHGSDNCWVFEVGGRLRKGGRNRDWDLVGI